MCLVSCVTCPMSHVMFCVSPVTSRLSPVTNPNSYSQRPYRWYFPDYAHCTVGWFRKTQKPENISKRKKKLETVQKKVFKSKIVIRSSNRRRTSGPLDWIGLRVDLVNIIQEIIQTII